MFWLVSGKYPYDPLTKKGRELMMKEEYNKTLLDKVPYKLYILICSMIRINPLDRICITDLINNEFFVEMEKLS